jgi:tetratricopeptide (TPR) repeat protein
MVGMLGQAEGRHRRVGARTAVLLAALPWLGAAAPQAEWRRIDSPNFVVIGEVGARELGDVAAQFEGFRETLRRVLGNGVTSSAVPTVVIVFPSDSAFMPFMPVVQGKTLEVGGRFLGAQDINYIAIVSDGRPGRLRALFHEYAHLIMSNMSRNVPTWLSEGMAEYYSTFELLRGGREAVLASPLEDHVALLTDALNKSGLLTLEEMLKVDKDSPLYNEYDRRSVFYAQAWALTHLIVRGEPNRLQQLGIYFDRVTKGMPSLRAWQEAFGSLDMTGELERYIRRASFKPYHFKFNDKVAALESTARPLPPAEAHAHLSDFLLRDGRLAQASEQLALAAALDPENARVSVGAAQIEIARRDYVSCHNRLRGLAAPRDWLVAYQAGIAAADLAHKQGKIDQGLETARRFFAAARTERPDFPNAVARTAALELRTAVGPSAETASAMARASSLAPSRPQYAYLHAQILVRRTEFAAARSVLGSLVEGPYTPQFRDEAKSLMGEIPQLEAAWASARRATAAASIAGTPDVPAEPAWPVFRELRAGEGRFAAVLERIECGRGGEGVFHLTAGGAAVAVMSPKMSDVDHITYRDDLTGTVGCGQLKQPLAVLVTWRAATGKSGVKIAVAIEYLPKAKSAAR